MIKSLVIVVFCFSTLSLYSSNKDDGPIMRMKVIEGDTVLFDEIREIIIFPKRVFKSERDYNRYMRLVRDLKKVYPYAKLANNILIELNDEYIKLDKEFEKKKYVKEVEIRLKAEFEDELKKLTIRQGRLLIKLVDRETGTTTYELVKELRGGFSAFFWQTVAKIFGNDLKVKYDPNGEDRIIEEIITLIERGQI